MKKLWKWTLLMTGAIVAAAAVQQMAREPSQGIFYRVTGGQNTMYLLGSIHVGSREMYPMCDAIQQAIKKADTLVFECDTTSQHAMAATARLMTGDQPLSAAVSRECYQQVENAAEKLGYAMTSFDGMKPWAVTSSLSVAAAAREMNAGSKRAASALSVENMVRQYAAGKEIRYLETAEEQLLLMDAFSPALQEYLLMNACQAVLDPQSTNGTEQDVELWPQWWKAGDAQAFANAYIQGLSKEASPELAQEYHSALMTTRNQTMARKLQEMLEAEERSSYVVTVGLMHLVLPQDSVIAQLQSMGYTVEQIVE